MLSSHQRRRSTGPVGRARARGALGVVGVLSVGVLSVGVLSVGAVGLSSTQGEASAVAQAASATRYDQYCDDDDYFTTGHNRDRSDDGCDTTRYGNAGHTGNSAPESWAYGHGRRDGDKPLGSWLFDGM